MAWKVKVQNWDVTSLWSKPLFGVFLVYSMEAVSLYQLSLNGGMEMSPPYYLTVEFGRSTLQFMVNSELTGVHNVTCRQNSLVNSLHRV